MTYTIADAKKAMFRKIRLTKFDGFSAKHD